MQPVLLKFRQHDKTACRAEQGCKNAKYSALIHKHPVNLSLCHADTAQQSDFMQAAVNPAGYGVHQP